MLENIKGVIFDLDGSLADSMWVWSAVDDEYIKRYKLQRDRKSTRLNSSH